MTIEYQNTKADYIDFYKFLYKSNLKNRSWFIVIAGLIFIISTSNPPNYKWYIFVVSALAYSGFILSLFYFFPLFSSVKKLKKQLIQFDGQFETKTLSITNDGLHFASLSETKEFQWWTIKEIHSVEGFIYVLFLNKTFIVIPKSGFSSQVEVNAFVEQIQLKTASAQLHKVPVYGKPRPPYWLGLLCLIPLIGAFIGLGLLLYGILNYKDKWLVLIGIGGIAFTILVYSTLIVSTNSNVWKKGFVPFAQSDLNVLMKSIEFYKLENGVYPDSLKEVIKDNNFTSINDPVNNGTKYNYKKVGNRYYLFSSGLDGIPNTKDDIYPTVAIKDSSKFGLIHN